MKRQKLRIHQNPFDGRFPAGAVQGSLHIYSALTEPKAGLSGEPRGSGRRRADGRKTREDRKKEG